MNVPTIDIVKAVIGDDMRPSDLRAAIKYYQRGIEYLSMGDKKGANVCARAMDTLIAEWPSFDLMKQDLLVRIQEQMLDKIKMQEAV